MKIKSILALWLIVQLTTSVTQLVSEAIAQTVLLDKKCNISKGNPSH